MIGKIRLSKSSISQKEKDAVSKILDLEYLGMGQEVELFEQDIKKYLKTDFEVVCVSNGTAALHLTLIALGLKKNDEVLVPSLTYIASFQAISATGAVPIPCEVDPKTLFIDIDDAKSRITKNTKAIMPVHYASSSIGMDSVHELAKEYDLRVVEDAAQAFGSKRDGNNVGCTGDIVCFSFDGIKNITSGEGGAILSKDKDFVQRVKDARLLGVEKDTEKRYNDQRSWDFDVKEQGFRYHMSNIMAAIGRVQLLRIDQFKTKRQDIVDKYLNEFKGIGEVEFLDFNFTELLPHIFVIKARQRDDLRTFLLQNNIECGVHFKPNHLLSKFSVKYDLPITEKVYEQILTLPCHYDLSNKEQDYVIEKIKEFYGK